MTPTPSPFADDHTDAAAAMLARAMQAIGQASVHGPFEVEVRVRVVPAGTAARERQIRHEREVAHQQRTEPLLFRQQGSRGGLSR